MNIEGSHYRDRRGERLVEEAAEWFARMNDPDASAALRAEFSDWLSASAEHVREYLQLAGLQSDIGELPATASADDLIRALHENRTENIVPLSFSSPLPRQGERVRVRGLRYPRFAIAASIFIASSVAFWFWQQTGKTVYRTAIGEQKSFTLPDGSVVTLNAVSRLQAEFTERRRDIELLSGEALFSVAQDPRRPFRVLTRDSVIQAVGTRFNVRHRQVDDTTVTVIEGRVKIASSRPSTRLSRGTSAGGGWVAVAAGQRARVGGPGVIDISAADTAVNTAWRDRRLVFESRPLSEVVAEFNLYNERPLQIRDPSLNAIQVSGSFYANDPQSFILFLQEAGIAQAQARGGEVQLLPLK